MLHMAAFYESVDPAGAYNALTPVPDSRLQLSGDDLRVPTLSKVYVVAAGVETAAANRARLNAPSLRTRGLFQVQPLNGAAAGAVEPASPAAAIDLRARPLELMRGENCNFEVLSDPVAAQIQWGLVLFGDAIEPIPDGQIFTVRATDTAAAPALTAGTWTSIPLLFDDDLPVGRYAIVGMRALSAGLIAARFSFVGGGWQPGVIGVDANADITPEYFRYAGLGKLGEFEDDEPPQIECLAVSADAAQEFWLDLIQIRVGRPAG